MAERSHLSSEGNPNGNAARPSRPTSVYRKLRRELSKTKLRIPHIWLRHRGLEPSDVFIASYPRSGVSWTRFILFEILTGREAGFAAVNAGIRGVGRHSMGLRPLPENGRLIATHEQYRKEYRRAIYLVRDGRDVALSEFAYTTALEFFHGNLDEFLQTFFCGKISAFAPWHRHVGSWLDSPIAETERLLVVHYEDLRQNPVPGFTRLAEFLGVDVDQERIQRAVANNSLEKMKKKEVAEPQRASMKDRFVRNGFVQGWRSKLTDQQLEFIEQHAGSVLTRLGYPVFSREQPVVRTGPAVQKTASFS
jgi:hypothetical protein